MPDDILGNVEELKRTLPELTEQIDGVADAENRLADSTSAVTERVGVFTGAVKEGSLRLSDFLNTDFSGSKILDFYASISDKAKEATSNIQISEIASSDMAINAASALGTVLLPKVMEGSALFGRVGNDGAAAGMKLTDSFSGIGRVASGIGGLAGSIGGVTDRLLAVAEQARNAELSIFRYAAQAGDLNDILEDGKSVQDILSDGLANFTQRIEQVGTDTGRASSQVAEYYARLAQIPGAVREGGITIDAMGDSMDTLTATMKVADAFMMSHEDLMSHLTRSYRNFTETGVEGALQQVAAFARSAQNLKMPMDMMRGYIDSVTQGMASMGDGTEAAINLADTLGTRLRDTGTSVQGTVDILGQMGRAAKTMDMGQAAFVSQMSGGPGGLAGAFEIEALRQEGRVDEIVRMAMTAIQRTTGPVTTLGDVREDPSRAGALMQQTQMLQQFGLAADNQQAFRLLEAMKQGDFENITQALQDPQKALEEAIERGTDIQKTGLTRIAEINNRIESVLRAISSGALDFTRGIDRSGMLGESPNLDARGLIPGVDERVSAEQWRANNPIGIAKEMATNFTATLRETFAQQDNRFEVLISHAQKIEELIKSRFGISTQPHQESLNISTDDIRNDLLGAIQTPAEAMNFERLQDIEGEEVAERMGLAGMPPLDGTLDVNIKVTDEFNGIIDRRIKTTLKEVFGDDIMKSFIGQGRSRD